MNSRSKGIFEVAALNANGGLRRGGAVSEREVAAFLRDNQFIHDRQGRESCWRHLQSGKRISIPPHHSGKNELKRGTLRGICRNIEKILGCQVIVVSGRLAAAPVAANAVKIEGKGVAAESGAPRNTWKAIASHR